MLLLALVLVQHAVSVPLLVRDLDAAQQPYCRRCQSPPQLQLGWQQSC
jgi:hypothetical protein